MDGSRSIVPPKTTKSRPSTVQWPAVPNAPLTTIVQTASVKVVVRTPGLTTSPQVTQTRRRNVDLENLPPLQRAHCRGLTRRPSILVPAGTVILMVHLLVPLLKGPMSYFDLSTKKSVGLDMS